MIHHFKVICKFCTKEFFVNKARVKIAKFCSKSCSSKYHFPEKQKAFLHNRSGINHPMWNGGRSKNSQGYILVYSPNHPYKDGRNCVREHRLIMEKSIGRYLLPTEEVHHLNHNKQDNRIENLQLFSNGSDHIKYGHPAKKGPQFKKVCPKCEKVFYVTPSRLRIVCCSISCGKKGRKLSDEHKRKIGLKSLGRIPWHKGTKGLIKRNRGSFQKGHSYYSHD